LPTTTTLRTDSPSILLQNLLESGRKNLAINTINLSALRLVCPTTASPVSGIWFRLRTATTSDPASERVADKIVTAVSFQLLPVQQLA
jgi:hypothetical protein